MYKVRKVTVVTAGPTLLWQLVDGDGTAGESTVTPAAGRYRAGTFTDPVPIIIKNTGANICYLGTSTLAATAGLPLTPGTSLAFSVTGNDALYARASTATTVEVLVGRQ